MKNTLDQLLIDGKIAFWAFDFDGNILAPETPIYVLDRNNWEEIAISWHKLDKYPELIMWADAPYRWHDDMIDSLIHFRDYHSDPRHRGPDKLKEDIEKALEQDLISPSFKSLKDLFLIPARFLSIITSRWHGPDNLARILWIINESLLSDEEKEIQQKNIENLYWVLEKKKAKLTRDQALRYYFEQVVTYYPVSNPHVAKYLGMNEVLSMSERKSLALAHSIRSLEERIYSNEKLHDIPLSIWFSDDSKGNILSILEYFREKKMSQRGNSYTYHLYFTGKKEDYTSFSLTWVSCQEKESMLFIKLID